MCSIHGFVMTAGTSGTAHEVSLAAAVRRGADRGRDSWGVATSTGQQERGLGAIDRSLVLEPCRWAVANCRAEPTTEYVADKTMADVQPFVAEGVTVSHNGTIANDRALAQRYGIEVSSRVDSAVLPHVFARSPFPLAEVLRDEVVGSYALAVGRGDELTLACNYRPLYLARIGNAIWFSSSPAYLGVEQQLDVPVMRVPPYSIVSFRNGEPVVESLRPSHSSDRVLVVCSGGLDSTVAATCYARAGRPVTLLHFTYGCRAEAREVRAVHDVAAKLGAEVLVVDMRDVFTNVIGGSPLTNTGASFAAGEAGAEYAFEWVPARNLILLSVAVGVAEAHGHATLVLGNNVEEAGAYPDNEQEFIRLLNDVLPYAVADGKRVQIEMPVGGLVKHEIVQLGHRLDAPIAESWSCYNGGEVHCGECGPCFMRREAHRMTGIDDPTVYAGTSL